jgi:hypothetical protein
MCARSEQVARSVASRFAALPEVEAVAMGGSQAAARADEGSDLDLYVYARPEPSLAARAALAAGSPRAELGNRFYEPGDEWIDPESGLHVDAMYRDPRWIEEELDRVLVRHEARVGYSTAFWYGVQKGVALFDRTGWYARLRARAQAPYPEALTRAVVAKNLPLLRANLSSFAAQLDKAVARRDLVSANHRAAAFLASAFDVLFALNRLPHPGEKRLLAIALATCPLRPPELAAQVEGLLAAAAAPGPELARRAEELGAALEALARAAGLEVTPPRTSTA